jgi:DNA-binding NarL/FixJ family response regulator
VCRDFADNRLEVSLQLVSRAAQQVMQTLTEHKSIKVLMVDDTVDIAVLFRRLIDSQKDMSCVGMLHDANQLDAEVERLHPDVVVLDLTMPGKPPLNALRELSSRSEQPRVLAFSGFEDFLLG